MSEQLKSGVPPTEEFDDVTKEFIEAHEFPNRMKLSKNDEVFDMDGNSISPGQVLFYQPQEGVKMKGETIYGPYMDERGNSYWVKIGDADYRALRKYGFTKAQP